MNEHPKDKDCPCAQCDFWRAATVRVTVLGSKGYDVLVALESVARNANDVLSALKRKADR